jgi:hypothetical protein
VRIRAVGFSAAATGAHLPFGRQTVPLSPCCADTTCARRYEHERLTCLLYLSRRPARVFLEIDQCNFLATKGSEFKEERPRKAGADFRKDIRNTKERHYKKKAYISVCNFVLSAVMP